MGLNPVSSWDVLGPRRGLKTRKPSRRFYLLRQLFWSYGGHRGKSNEERKWFQELEDTDELELEDKQIVKQFKWYNMSQCIASNTTRLILMLQRNFQCKDF